jgi:uncharacterized protein
MPLLNAVILSKGHPVDHSAAADWTESDIRPPIAHLWTLMGIGLIAGVASALFGIGSGVIIVPILSGFMGYPLKRAIGVSIPTVLGVVSAGVLTEALATNNIQWHLALVIAIGAQVGVWIGGKVRTRISSKVLRYSFIALLVFTALKLSRIVEFGGSDGLFTLDQWSPWFTLIFALGVLAGFLSVLLGIGGGIVITPGLVLLVDGILFRTARATSLAVIIPTAFSAMLIHLKQKNILWKSVIPIVIPGFFGAFGGVMLANTISNVVLKQYLFPVFLVLMIVRLGFKNGKNGER